MSRRLRRRTGNPVANQGIRVAHGKGLGVWIGMKWCARNNVRSAGGEHLRMFPSACAAKKSLN